jgi:peptide-methionine (S)-S-oxide reductase
MKFIFFVLSLFLFSQTNVLAAAKIELATFGGGCFWCMEGPFDKLDGVLKTVSGFSGGKLDNPSYKQVSYGGTGHTEVVQITFDANKISYADLLKVYWRNVDPLDSGGQFCDRGPIYRPVVFSHDEAQKNAAQQSKDALTLFGKNITPIEDYKNFFAAEDYHQDYYQKNPLRYNYYRSRCGRDQRLEMLWGSSH